MKKTTHHSQGNGSSDSYPPTGGDEKKEHWEDIVELPGVEYSKDKLHRILTLNSITLTMCVVFFILWC